MAQIEQNIDHNTNLTEEELENELSKLKKLGEIKKFGENLDGFTKENKE